MKHTAILALLGVAFAGQAHAVHTLDLTLGTAGGDAFAASATSLFMTTAFDANDDAGTDFNFSGMAPLAAGGGIGSMEAFTGHPAGEYDIGRFDASASAATEGSVYVLKNIAVAAGDKLSFNWAFYTNEPLAGGFKDAAYFSVLNNMTALLATADGVNGGAGLSGYRAATGGIFNYTFANAGSYDLVFAVVDTDDFTTSSALMINNATITPVPEPKTWAMLAAGLGLVGMMAARNRRRLM